MYQVPIRKMLPDTMINKNPILEGFGSSHRIIESSPNLRWMLCNVGGGRRNIQGRVLGYMTVT